MEKGGVVDNGSDNGDNGGMMRQYEEGYFSLFILEWDVNEGAGSKSLVVYILWANNLK